MKFVISKTIEHIHRNNLVGMDIIPLCFKSREDVESLTLTEHERYSIDLSYDIIDQLNPCKDIIVTTNTRKCMLCFQLLIFTCFFLLGRTSLNCVGSYDS